MDAGALRDTAGKRRLRGRVRLGHALGGLALFFTALQVVTGVLLLAYYRPR